MTLVWLRHAFAARAVRRVYAMAPMVLLTMLATLVQAQAPAARPPVPAGVTAFIGVNVVPMDTERVLPNHTVLIQGGRITALGPVNRVTVPATATQIDARGKYLIPGLGDCHVHLRFSSRNPVPEEWEQRLFPYVANGITTLRNMDHRTTYPEGLRVRAWAAAEKILSPRLYVGGSGEWPHSVSENKPSEVHKARLDSVASYVAAFKATGHDFIKIYSEWGPIYDSVLGAARRLGIPVMGHVPKGVPLEQALRLRQTSIEHLEGYTRELITPRYDTWNAGTMRQREARDGLPDSLKFHPDSLAAQRRQLDFAKIPVLAAATARAGVWNCPTLRVYEVGNLDFRYDSMPLWPEVEYLPPAEREAWQNKVRATPKSGSTDLDNGLISSEASGTIVARRQIVKALQDSGAGVLLGTDLNRVGTVQGVAIHRELQALVRAGLTPYQALAAGTRNIAQFFGTLDETGTVAVGKRADLVLLNGNPLADIQNTMQPVGVMLGGRWLSRAEIDRRLAALWATNPGSKRSR